MLAQTEPFSYFSGWFLDDSWLFPLPLFILLLHALRRNLCWTRSTHQCSVWLFNNLVVHCVGKSTAHARFQEWVQAGAFERAWARVLAVYEAQVGVDWVWQAADGCMVKAPLGKKGLPERRKRLGAIPLTAPNPASSATC